MLHGERFREGNPSNTNNPSNNPEQYDLHPWLQLYTQVYAHAYYSTSDVTRAVSDYSSYSYYSDSLSENDWNAQKDHAVRITL